ncbi:MAG: hypothetical protein ACD_79C01130G0006 [uncultured bacterium]|nr:MAG: hypothetical protein ACD_79C01130G0006 [uncultured bacterium]
MFTREDYIEYFENIASKERSMVYKINELIPKIQDEYLKNALSIILLEEMYHHKLISILFSKYIYPKIEARKIERDYALGDALLKNIETGLTIKIRCLDISLSGIGIETELQMKIGDAYEINLHLFDGGKTIHLSNGKLKWFRKSSSTFYKGGIEFENYVEIN